MAHKPVANWTQEDYDRAAMEYSAHPGILREKVSRLQNQIETIRAKIKQTQARTRRYQQIADKEEMRFQREKKRADEAAAEVERLRTLVEQLQGKGRGGKRPKGSK